MALSSLGLAEPQPKSPHKEAETKTGVITGTLLEDNKTKLSNHQVWIEIMRQGELVLTIPKETDLNGRYQFRNIFQSPEFSYAVGTEYKGRVYRTDAVRLKEGETVKRLDLVVGAGAEAIEPPPPPVSEAPLKGRGEYARVSTSEYKLLAALLSVGAVGLAFYHARRKK